METKRFRQIATSAIFVLLATVAHSSATTMLGVAGTVFNNSGSGSDGLAGVSVTLFADDGNGLFDPVQDAIVASAITDATGQYSFDGLDESINYFVRQAPQTVGGVEIMGSVTNLLGVGAINLVIDDFADQQEVEANPVRLSEATNLTSSRVIGGQRDIYVEYLGGPAEATVYANPFGLSEVLEFSQSAGVFATATITWDGIDSDLSTTPTNGLGGIDLMSDGSQAFVFDLGIDAAGAGDDLIMRIFSGDEVSVATIPLPVTNGTATVRHLVPFSSFVGDADLTNVEAIQLQLGGDSPSIDAQLGPIGTTGPAIANFSVVTPEPSAFLMFLFTAVWVVGSRRRKRTRR